MKTQLQEILNSLYEAEGLLEMALRRGESYYVPLAELARDKCFHIADLAAALEIPEHHDDDADDEKSAGEGVDADDAEKMFVDKIVPKLDAELADATEKEFEAMADVAPTPEVATDSLSVETEEDTDKSAAEEVENLESEVEKTMYQDVIGDREIADASIFEEEEDAGENPDYGQDSEQTQVDTDKQEYAPVRMETVTPSIFSDEDIDSVLTADNMEESKAEDELDYSDEDIDDEEESVNTHVGALNRKPIATFFSINDKFRFRRELFGNSTPEWLDTLAMLETMQDIDEAKDYLFDDLQWVADSLEVKAFIEVITRYYNS